MAASILGYPADYVSDSGVRSSSKQLTLNLLSAGISCAVGMQSYVLSLRGLICIQICHQQPTKHTQVTNLTASMNAVCKEHRVVCMARYGLHRREKQQQAGARDFYILKHQSMHLLSNSRGTQARSDV